MFVMTDVDDPFAAAGEGVLAMLSGKNSSRPALDALLSALPSMHANTRAAGRVGARVSVGRRVRACVLAFMHSDRPQVRRCSVRSTPSARLAAR
jgi:hypothetical protein